MKREIEESFSLSIRISNSTTYMNLHTTGNSELEHMLLIVFINERIVIEYTSK